MNKVISVNLGGIAYQLEEDGYEALRSYLNTALEALRSDPDKEEIVADIEAAIGDKFRVLLGVHKNVVTGREVAAVLREMGPVESGSGKQAAGSSSAAGAAGPGGTAGNPAPAAGFAKSAAQEGTDAASQKDGRPVRRLYRLEEGAMLFGVCSGLAAFMRIDAIVVRALFIGFTFATMGLMALVYVTLVIFVPKADSAAERAQAQGPIPTAQDFIRRAREGYYEAMKDFPDRQARRKWKRQFKDDMREWGRRFGCEMKSNSANWRERCERGLCDAPRPLVTRLWLFLLFVVFSCLILGAGLFGVLSLVSTGTVLGFGLPPGMPVWVGILLLVFLCQFLFWPLSMLSGCCPRRRHGGGGGGFFMFVLLVGLAWWIYPTQTKAVLREIPPAVQQGADAVRDWWHNK